MKDEVEFPPIIGLATTAKVLRCSRTKVWLLRHNDPDFPPGLNVAGNWSCGLDEMLQYRASRSAW